MNTIEPYQVLCFVTDCTQPATHMVENPLEPCANLPKLEVCREHWKRRRDLYWYRGRLSDTQRSLTVSL